MEQAKRRSIIDLSCVEARVFLLKQESYCNFDLPPYFQFDELLNGIIEEIRDKPLSSFGNSRSSRNLEDVNYRILNNKDGKYAWRPLELIHPALYVSVVNKITKQDHWERIRNRCSYFRSNPKVKCLSLPVESLTNAKDKAEQISQWWEDVEQKSIELSLDYEFIIHTDIADCYPRIYTHSIVWALHGKKNAKKFRQDRNLTGNIIDNHILDMRQGQTNGIPQGSVLMDFIAEMVLGYADSELTKKINGSKIEDYQILRYRDDYRIFVSNPNDGERILKCLTEVTIELGLQLNPAKTNASNEVIRSSIKEDKLNWMSRRQGDRNLQKHLLIIHQHSINHPNSGSVVNAMRVYYKRIYKLEKCPFPPMPLIAIVADIVYGSPRTYNISAAMLSKLIDFLETESEKQSTVERVREKFSRIPNTGYMEIWLQRFSHSFAPEIEFDEPLCQLVSRKGTKIWNNDWISSRDLLKAIDPKKVINRKALDAIDPVVPPKEVELWPVYP